MLLSCLAALPFAWRMPRRQLLASKPSEHPLERRQHGPTYPAHTMDMPIDHFPDNPRYAPHTTETFAQRYYFDSTYYKLGGPVFLYIGGETRQVTS